MVARGCKKEGLPQLKWQVGNFFCEQRHGGLNYHFNIHPTYHVKVTVFIEKLARQKIVGDAFLPIYFVS